MNIGLIILVVILFIIVAVMIYPIVLATNRLNSCIGSENILCPTYTCKTSFEDDGVNFSAFRVQNGQLVYQKSVSTSGKAPPGS